MRGERYRMSRASGLVCSAMLCSTAAMGLVEVVPGLRQLRSANQVVVYIFAVQFVSNLVCAIVGVLGLLVALNYVSRSTVLATMLFAIMSAFGSVMSIATVVFTASWNNHSEAMGHVTFIFLGVVGLADAGVVAVLTTCLLRRSILTYEYHSWSSVRKAVPVIASLTMISGLTSILGFALRMAVHVRLPASNQYGGGVFSGLTAVIGGILAIVSMYSRCSRHDRVLIASVILALLTIVASAISLYTERLELNSNLSASLLQDAQKSKGNNDPESHAKRVMRNIVLAKCTLVLFSNLFNILFVFPLLICLCYLMRKETGNIYPTDDDQAVTSFHTGTGADLLMTSSATGSAGLPDGPLHPVSTFMRNELSKPGNSTLTYSTALRPY